MVACLNPRRWSGLLVWAACSTASAADWSLAAGLASDKVVRGLSQTGGQSSLLLDLGWRGDGGWTASLAGASLHRRGAAEWSAGLGWQRQLDAQWQGQLGLVRYGYVAARDLARPYTEVYGALAWDGRATLLLALSPDTRFVAADGSAPRNHSRHAEFTWHQRLVGPLSLDLGLGHIHFSRLPSYAYGSVGLGWSRGPLQLFLTHIDSRAAQRGVVPADVAGRRWVASGSWVF